MDSQICHIDTGTVSEYLTSNLNLHEAKIWNVQASYSGFLSVASYTKEASKQYSTVLDLKHEQVLFAYPGEGFLSYPNRYWICREDDMGETISIYDLENLKRYVLVGFDEDMSFNLYGQNQSDSYIYLITPQNPLLAYEIDFEKLAQYTAIS